MPRPTKKRKIGEIDYDDPMSYVRDYCHRHGLPDDVGNSSAEKECAQRAAEAREEFKTKRDAAASQTTNSNDGSRMTMGTSGASLVAEDRNDRKGLSPAQKYTIRLQNNRKSAYASKVYSEILKRELSHRLQKQSDNNTACSKCRDFKKLQAQEKEGQSRIAEFEEKIRSLREELHAERKKVAFQDFRNVELTGRLKKMTERAEQLTKQAEEAAKNERQSPTREEVGASEATRAPTQNDAEQEEASPPLPIEPPPSQTTVIEKSESPDESRLRGTSNDGLSQEVIPPPTVPKSQSQTQQECTPPSQPMSLHQRIITSRGGFPLSPCVNESEGREFHCALTFSQSQHDDTDDKAQLMRNMPTAGGIPGGIMGSSQPSQSEIGAGAFKSSLGSDDLAIGGDADLLMNSQGTQGTQGTPSGNRKATQTSS